MILQALASYYERLSADPNSDIAPIGWAKVEIPFVFVINNQGTLIQIEDTREMRDNSLRAKTFLVPQAVKRASGVASNLLWDTAVYATGCFLKEGLKEEDLEKKSKRAIEQQRAFIQRIEASLADSPKKRACLHFLSSISDETLSIFPEWKEIVQSNANVSIRFIDDLFLYCQDKEVKAVVPGQQTSEVGKICLITGNIDTPSRLHTAIKGVYGAQSVGANIVSFNLKPFLSYGKEQGENAQIGESAMFAYTTALNSLLARDSRQRMQIGDASTVFWSKKRAGLNRLLPKFLMNHLKTILMQIPNV